MLLESKSKVFFVFLVVKLMGYRVIFFGVCVCVCVCVCRGNVCVCVCGGGGGGGEVALQESLVILGYFCG